MIADTSSSRPRGRTAQRDDVVLLDEDGMPIGRADRMQVHSTTTPLHLAFSTYVFNAHGEVLVTRSVVEHAGNHLDFEPIGEVRLKGFAEPTELFLVGLGEE